MGYSPLPIDTTVGAAVVVDTAHHEVHEGESYFATYVATGVGSGSNVDIRFQAPDTSTRIHLVWEVDANEEFEIYLYEAGNVTAGTALDLINRERNSANTATLVVTYTPTVTTTGNLIFHAYRGNSAAAQSKVGGTERDSNELILDQNGTYLLRVTSRAAGCDVSVLLEWYEES